MCIVRRRTAPVFWACIVFSCAGASHAAPYWEYLSGDVAFDYLTAYGNLVEGATEARAGNGDTTGTWEQAIWWRLPGMYPPAVTAQHDIVNGADVDFEVSWRGSDNTLMFTLGAQTISWDGVSGNFSDVFIRVFAYSGLAFVRLTDLDLVGSGLQLPDLYSVPNGAEYIRINQYGPGPKTLFGDFTLTGTHNFSWVDSFPPEGGLSVRVYLTWVIPAPGGAALFAIVGACAARRRRVRDGPHAAVRPTDAPWCLFAGQSTNMLRTGG